MKTSMKLTSYQIGICIISFSAVVWSTLGLFAQGIDAQVWVILFWRGLFSIVFLSLYVCYKSKIGIYQEIGNLGWPGWLSAIIGAAATVCFISAFKYTSIANVSIVYATIPFIVSVLAWLFLRETIQPIAIACALIALFGVFIMVQGSAGSTHIIGDVLALLMAIGMSALVVLFRKYPTRPMVLSTLFSAAIHLLLSLLLSEPFTVSWQDLMGLIVFGALFATATILTVEGSRLIPAFQSAMIGTLEAPLAVLWAWLIFSQTPAFTTWIGGSLVTCAVILNMYAHHRSQSKSSAIT